MLLIPVIFTFKVIAQPFQENTAVSSVLPGVKKGCVKWVDFDVDGDYDILISGETVSGDTTVIFRKDDDTFTDILAGLPSLKYSDASWSDFDNDNDPDLLLSGLQTTGDEMIPVSYLYLNNSGVFEQIPCEITGEYGGSSKWGDLDNDGDYDLVICGNTGENGVTEIYRNNGNYEFEKIAMDFVGIFDGEVDLGDYNNDSYIDILMCGFFKNAQNDTIRTLKVYRNDGDFSFTSISSPFVGMGQANVSWWDYDSDGDLDIIANGSTDAPTYLVYIYQNMGNDIFGNIGIEIFGTVNGDIAIGDYDNDGDEDFLLTGFTSYNNQPVSVVYRNVGNNLFNKDYSVDLAEVEYSNTQWCDYDGNGNLDILLSGRSMQAEEAVTVVYDNKNSMINIPPEKPQNLNVEIDYNMAYISWDSSSDVETPSNGLTYNLRVGTIPFGTQIVSPLAGETGKMCLVIYGNVGHNTGYVLNDLGPGIYYFSVQAVDNGFESSAFSADSSFVVAISAFPEKEKKRKMQVIPNPASSFVKITVVPNECIDCPIIIYDIHGKEIKKTYPQRGGNDDYEIIWNLTDNTGLRVNNGTYIAKYGNEVAIIFVK